MNKLLGLLDVLESMILDAKKMPLTDKVILEEKPVIDLLDKLRITIKSNGDVIESQINIEKKEDIVFQSNIEKAPTIEELDKAKKIKEGAEQYASHIITNLQLAVTKMQTNLIKLEKNIESSRAIIEEKKEQMNATQNTKENTND